MRSHLRLVLLAGLALLASVAPATAQTGGEIRGEFVRDVAASDAMDRIVDSGMSKLGKLYRVWPISTQAKKRLRETNEPYAWVRITPEGESVTVETDHYRLTTPRNGTHEDWERSEGDLIDVTTSSQSGRLEQSFDASDGRRVNVYTLSPDGSTLMMDVTVTSPKLDSPLTYRQVYRRKA